MLREVEMKIMMRNMITKRRRSKMKRNRMMNKKKKILEIYKIKSQRMHNKTLRLSQKV